jgi:hypothetical protein
MTLIYITIAVLAVAGWVSLFIVSRRSIQSECAALRVEFERQIGAVSAEVRRSQLRALQPAADAQTASSSARALAPVTALAAANPVQQTDEITPETVAMITKTITALLGKKIRVLSVKLLQMPNVTPESWAHQGRVVVQASHNLVQRGRE